MTLPSPLAAAGVVAGLALALAPAAQARIGETLAECTARYGPARASMPAVVAESDPEAARFEYGTLGVIVHFHKGVAWHVSYAQSYLSDPDKHRLLKETMDTGTWEPRNGHLAGNVLLWNHRAAKLVACGINRKSLNTLEVMTRPCAEAFGRARAKRIDQAMSQGVPRAEPAAGDAPR